MAFLQTGTWQQVADKCCKGHYQPLLLLYANPHPSTIDTRTAPARTTMVPGYSFSNDPSEYSSAPKGVTSSVCVCILLCLCR